jgi:biopolymer transport protein ExbD
MTALNNSDNQNKKKKSKRRSIHVDLTPMVDLGFLLITFFVFTTNLSKANAMDMLVPNDKDTITSPVCESCALTVVLGKNDHLYYYEGKDKATGYKETTYAADGIRNLIVQKKRALQKTNSAFTVQLIIKPTINSSFKNLVDIIDEANICALKRYYIAELNDKDFGKTD